MMSFLGIDYGRRHVGLAISAGRLAAPLRTLDVRSSDDLLIQLKSIVDAEGVDTIIIGLPDGKIAISVTTLIPRFVHALGVEVIAWDETLTSKWAAQTMIRTGVPQQKRRQHADAVAAALILQSYLDASRS